MQQRFSAACHIRVGEVSWCQCNAALIPGVYNEAIKRSLYVTCAQTSAADAVAFVHMLQDLGVKDATVAEGQCEWDPSNAELRKLKRRA